MRSCKPRLLRVHEDVRRCYKVGPRVGKIVCWINRLIFRGWYVISLIHKNSMDSLGKAAGCVVISPSKMMLDPEQINYGCLTVKKRSTVAGDGYCAFSF